jgi:hypothetical protein
MPDRERTSTDDAPAGYVKLVSYRPLCPTHGDTMRCYTTQPNGVSYYRCTAEGCENTGKTPRRGRRPFVPGS